MGFKFRKRIKIAPGISINIGKSGITSATVGKRGASLNIGKNGVKATAGILALDCLTRLVIYSRAKRDLI